MRRKMLAQVSCAIVPYALAACALGYSFSGKGAMIEQYDIMDRPARISPDYSDTVVPPNIAPLNFSVQESGRQYYVKIYSKEGRAIEIFSGSPKIVMPEDPWHKLLDVNRGEQLCFDIFVKSASGGSASRTPGKPWKRFSTISNDIAREDIDGFLVYRKIQPVHSTWREMGIYQRNLQRFDESLILHNGYFEHGCVNCHTFCNNRTDKMLIGIRSPKYGNSALLIEDGKVNKIGAKFGYTCWHPSGRLAVFSVNNVTQFFHSARSEVRDVMDLDSLLAYYLVESGKIRTCSNIAKKDRLETYPAWSPDGRYLYFCSAALSWSDRKRIPEGYDQIKYDLVRTSYDLDRDQWGQLETIVTAQQTGLSILLPRISPDGRWLLFCMCNYGCFPVYQVSSDLYMIDLDAERQNGRYEYRRLDINSDQSETWHCWSSNSRWIAFSSKRDGGVFTRIYLSYVDSQGRVCKPFVLPQKNPTYYDSCLWTYSVPELVIEPVATTKEKLGRVVRGSPGASPQMPITMATPKAPAAPRADEVWLGERE